MSKELLVKTNNRDMLDKTLQAFGGLVSEDSEGSGENKKYAVRSISGDLDYLKFVIGKQGYAKIVGEREI